MTPAILQVWSGAPCGHGHMLGRPARPDRGEDPILAFGILGPGTERTDRGDKARAYRSAPSVRRCVMPRQDSVAAGAHARDGEDGRSPPMPAVRGRHPCPAGDRRRIPPAGLRDGADLPPLDLRDDGGSPIVAP